MDSHQNAAVTAVPGRQGRSVGRGRRRAVAAAAVLAAGLGVASATPASAVGSYIGSNSGGANIRTCGSTTCRSLGYLPNGTSVSMMCWTDSQWVYPPSSDYASPRWFKVGTLALGGVIGYVHSSLVEAQTSVPHC